MTTDSPFPDRGHGREAQPVHTGLRPLSPFGEGYCRWCHFVIGLTFQGVIEQHTRSASMWRDEAEPCKGSYARPPKVTPYTSRKAAFRLTVPKEICPACTKEVRVTYWSGGYSYEQHLPQVGSTLCAMSRQRVQRRG